MDDPAVTALSELVPGGVRRGELRRGDRVLRWVEAGAGPATVILDAGAAEPGSLAWAGVLPALPRTRDRWTALQAGPAQTVPYGEHIVADGTGHAIHQERPELVAGAITRVLQHVTQP